MKILFFNWRDITNPSAGGAELYLHEIGKRLAKNHEVFLYCGKYKGCKERDELEGTKIIRRGGTFSIYMYAIFDYLFELRRGNFDVIVDSINGVPFLTPLFVRKPKLAVIHHLVGRRIFFRELLFPFAFIAWTAEKIIPFVYRRIPVVTVSESSKKELVEFGIASEQVQVIYNAIDHKTLEPGVKYEKPLIAYVGRLKKYKRLNHLLEAFRFTKRRIPEVRLIIAGRGDYTDLETSVKRLELEAWVSLRGEVSEVEKLDILQKAWIFVTPSMKEGWGVAVLEANACGTPAIAYDVPGLRDSIRDGKTGLLVPDGNIVALNDAIVKVLSNSEFRGKLSQNALKWASSFSWDTSVGQFTQLLESQKRQVKIE